MAAGTGVAAGGCVAVGAGGTVGTGTFVAVGAGGAVGGGGTVAVGTGGSAGAGRFVEVGAGLAVGFGVTVNLTTAVAVDRTVWVGASLRDTAPAGPDFVTVGAGETGTSTASRASTGVSVARTVEGVPKPRTRDAVTLTRGVGEDIAVAVTATSAV